MPHSDGSIDVTYWQWVTINNVRTLVHTDYLGTGRFWTVNQNPVAVNNDVQLNASQVRGTFNFNVTGPDYDYIEQLERGMFSAAETSVDYNAPFYTWGHGYDNMRIAFGQSNITLTDVNPQLSVAINSENKNYTYPGETFTGFPDHDDKVLRSPYPVTTLNVGNGTLSRIQGNVSVSNMIVNVDDSAGTNANNLILTSTTLGTWTTTGGTTHPVLSIGGLDSRTFTVIAGTVDKVDIESVPSTAGLTSVQTANNSTTPVDVYLMGRAQASAPSKPLAISTCISATALTRMAPSRWPGRSAARGPPIRQASRLTINIPEPAGMACWSMTPRIQALPWEKWRSARSPAIRRKKSCSSTTRSPTSSTGRIRMSATTSQFSAKAMFLT